MQSKIKEPRLIGLEAMLIAETEEGESFLDNNSVKNYLTESDEYICGECGKHKRLKEEMKEHPNDTHGHNISLEDTTYVKVNKPSEDVMKKKVELYETAVKNLKQTK